MVPDRDARFVHRGQNSVVLIYGRNTRQIGAKGRQRLGILVHIVVDAADRRSSRAKRKTTAVSVIIGVSTLKYGRKAA